jgi:exosortase K
LLALKFYYASASADQLRWILAPTTVFVELVTGTSFKFESHAGYLSRDRSFLIAPACAGVNFLITAFLMLSVRRLLRDRSASVGSDIASDKTWGFIAVAALVAYLVTLVANTARIVVALRLGALHLGRAPETSYLNRDELHRVEGILVYFGFLLLFYVISEKLSAAKPANLWRQACFPLLVYYAIVLGIPLANGAYRQGAAFWEHSLFVLLIPLLLLLPLAVFHWLRQRLAAGSA